MCVLKFLVKGSERHKCVMDTYVLGCHLQNKLIPEVRLVESRNLSACPFTEELKCSAFFLIVR